MRLFITVEIPENLKVELASWSFSKKGVSWVKAENMHITLKFLGEVDEKLVKNLIDRLSNIKFKAFNVKTNRAGFFPNESSPRVLWVDFVDGESLKSLARAVSLALPEFKKDHPFKDHLTLARIKHLANAEKENVVKKVKKIKTEGKEWVVKDFVLVRSILLSNGPPYGVLARFDGEKDLQIESFK